jgi:hypothetical protein
MKLIQVTETLASAKVAMLGVQKELVRGPFRNEYALKNNYDKYLACLNKLVSEGLPNEVAHKLLFQFLN